jgi:hypothetical protein
MNELTMDDMIGLAKFHIASVVEKLKGDEDFIPFMTILDSSGDMNYVTVPMPDHGERQELYDALLAICLSCQATKVVFAGIGWMVMGSADGSMPPVRPSRDPNRREVVTVAGMDGDNRTVFLAELKRTNGTVSLGKWTPTMMAGGMIQKSIIHGIRLAKSAEDVPEVSALIREMRIRGNEGDIIQSIVAIIRQERARRISDIASRN